MKKIEDYSHYYLLGIGGASMSGIAHYLLTLHKDVRGYDAVMSANCKDLQNYGVHIDTQLGGVSQIPTRYRHSSDDCLIIYSSAIKAGNPYFDYFSSNGFQMLKRGDVLGSISRGMKCVAIAGTHGKSTTTSILHHIFRYTYTDVKAFIGAIPQGYERHYIGGSLSTMLVEADEYDRAFMELEPTYLAITSTDPDHLDIYGTHQELVRTFEAFAKKVSKEDRWVHKSIGIPANTYSATEEADIHVSELRFSPGEMKYTADIHTPWGDVSDAKLAVLGRYNVENALCALGVALSYGVDLHKAVESLAHFGGVSRRFQTIDSPTLSKPIIDDFSHTPEEIHAFLSQVNELFPAYKKAAIFQPHLFSRTQQFAEGFAEVLAMVDTLIIIDIYPAREAPIDEITSQWLLEQVSLPPSNKVYAPDIPSLKQAIDSAHFDMLLVVGAGDIMLKVKETGCI